jgi:hypothetical protein
MATAMNLHVHVEQQPTILIQTKLSIMHTWDKKYIANQQGWRYWDYLIALVDGDAFMDTK